MKTLPAFDEMYRALCERDTSYDGAFYAAIRTTGIFCRPGCGAKKPKRESCAFYDSARAALEAGYRPCKRCRPMDPSEAPPAWVERVLERVERAPLERVRSDELRALGVEPARLARWFRAHYGMTFQAYHRARRVGLALKSVRGGASVTDTALASGFESESGFRAAFTKLFGAAPTKLAEGAQVIRVRELGTPLGPMLAAATAKGVVLLEFVDRRAIEAQVATLRRRMELPIVPGTNAVLDRLARELGEYFAGTRARFDVPLHAPGTPFQEAVWKELRAIPPGATRSYADVARALGRPTATRAVARANGDNRLALLLPCHRVIGSDGALTGYAGGLWRKEWLLAHERGERPQVEAVRAAPPARARARGRR
ncbi:MAG: methylated-DNA--[protein]-cysteine S-methyltransferase [Planctomycetes bacterium]|nr:methylated-DNA--[protein]-cysteine S-methyltransferase [Planctomycetota bacterium]